MQDEKMTLFYSKRTGEIKNYVTGVSDMGFYGEDEEDYSLIIDYIIVDLDEYVLANFKQFKIADKRIKLEENINLDKYL